MIHARNFVSFAEQALELFAIFVEVDGFLRDTGIHRSFGDGRRLPNQHARIEGLGDQVVGPKLQTLDTVSATDRVRNIFFGQIRQSMSRGQFHFFVDGGGANVQGSAEDERESQNIVDLVGIVGAAGGDDHIGASVLWRLRN